MNNPLKSIFTKAEPEFVETLLFNSEAERSAFIKAIEEATEKEQGIKVHGVKGILSFVQFAESRHSINLHEGEVAAVYVYPHTEKCPIELETDYGFYTFNLDRIRKEKEIVLQNNKDDIVYVRITIKHDQKNRATLTFKTKPAAAKNIADIVHAYNALRHLLKRFFPFDTLEEVKKEINVLWQLEKYWNRIMELENTLNISFLPSSITNSTTDKENIERLHFLLVKQLAIRESLKDVTATYTATDQGLPFSVGTHIGFAIRDKSSLTVYGTQIDIFTISIFFHAVVDGVEECPENGSYRVKFCGAETQPLYKVMCAYEEEDKLPGIEDFNKLYNEYADAKTFDELMEELYAD
jgi:hypothetical protein